MAKLVVEADKKDEDDESFVAVFCMHACMYVKYIFAHVFMYVSMSVYIYVCLHVFMYV